MLLDAVAWTIGRRVVVTLDGKVYLFTPEQSKEAHYVNMGGWDVKAPEGQSPQLSPFAVWAGGPSSYYEQARRPEKVRVVFPRYTFRTPRADGKVYTVESEGSKHFDDLIPGRVKTFYDTAAASFTTSLSTPANASDLKMLADKIAKDYYDWLQAGTYDLSCSGLRKWTPTGYDDAIWWHWGHQYPPETEDPLEENMEMEQGRYAAYTRIQCLPVDWGYSQVLHQFQGFPSEDDLITFILDTDFSAGGTATASVYEWDKTANSGHGGYVDTGHNIEVQDILDGWPDAPHGTWGQARLRDSNLGPVYEIVDLLICTDTA
jgi:hypothetical protein